MADQKDLKPHFFLGKTGQPELYTYAGPTPRSKKQIPELDRQQHGTSLLGQLKQVQTDQLSIKLKHKPTISSQS